MTALERRTVTALAGLYSFRMLGLFMVLPLLTLYGTELSGSTAFLLGLALGAYGLAQACLQIPLGLLSDRIGRVPVIIGGLLVFALGSLLAAGAESIYGVIWGRFLQGAGAIASTVMALVADSTSNEQRTKAMAVVGMSIGLSFALSLVLGPLLASFGGLQLVFLVTAGFAVLGILIVLLAVPRSPVKVAGDGEVGTVPALLWDAFAEPSLVRLNLSVFTLHFVLMGLFMLVPGIIESQLELHRDRHWILYLPVLALSLAGMVPLMILAERKGQLRLAFLLAVGALILAQCGFAGLLGNTGVYLGLWLFFVGFNYMEASLPSLVSKSAPEGARGTALGVFSTFQFLGAFAGGAVSGWVLQIAGPTGLVQLTMVVLVIWWLSCLTLQVPRFARI